MRHPRLKPDCRDTWHHCYNRAVGFRSDRPFDTADKEQFVRILHRVAKFYTVHIVGYQFMGNHIHLIMLAPVAQPDEIETIRRFEEFHDGKRTLKPGSAACRAWQERLRDISWCMRHLQHLCTAWYNRTRSERRRGPLWAGRFKNTVLEEGEALWNCWSYIEANAMRAGIVTDPADYRFCSYGVWMQSGHHPFAEALVAHLIPALPARLRNLTPQEVGEELKRRFREESQEAAPVAEQADVAAKADTKTAVSGTVGANDTLFTTSFRRRVRYWNDGLIIGSELFVRNMMARYRPALDAKKHRLTQALLDETDQLADVYCWQKLRQMLN